VPRGSANQRWQSLWRLPAFELGLDDLNIRVARAIGSRDLCHLVTGLEREHAQATVCEQDPGFPGACADFDDLRRRPQPGELEHLIDNRPRVGRPRAGIQLGNPSERQPLIGGELLVADRG
jgi:hypothetical protein